LALEIRTLGDPVLRERCREVREIDGEVKSLIEHMEETLGLAAGYGLAASQVGSVKRLFVYNAGHGPRCLLNPEIVSSEGTGTLEEGCLSVPGVYVEVSRPGSVRMRCTTSSGHRITIEPGGFLARVFQHEIDHLDGVLIVDRCGDDERKRALAEYSELQMERKRAGA